ncbi:MAG: hypothetical protein ACJAVI_005899, partial [Candidatus Azotimanducaceae bacterium]
CRWVICNPGTLFSKGKSKYRTLHPTGQDSCRQPVILIVAEQAILLSHNNSNQSYFFSTKPCRLSRKLAVGFFYFDSKPHEQDCRIQSLVTKYHGGKKRIVRSNFLANLNLEHEQNLGRLYHDFRETLLTRFGQNDFGR